MVLIMRMLLINMGWIVARSMIVEHVWHQSFEKLTNIVDVYVRQLRARLDEPYPLRLGHAARGAGCSRSETER